MCVPVATARLLQEHGIGPDQVTQVRGFADQRLRKKDPLDPANRRISLIVQYLEKKSASGDTAASPSGAAAGEKAASPQEPAEKKP